MKKYSYPTLLDYVNGELNEDEMNEIHKHLEKNPNDAQVVEGVRLFYKLEQTDRIGLETYLNNELSDTEFLYKKIREVKLDKTLSRFELITTEDSKNQCYLRKRFVSSSCTYCIILP